MKRNLLGFVMRYGTNKEKNTVRGGVETTGNGEATAYARRRRMGSTRFCQIRALLLCHSHS